MSFMILHWCHVILYKFICLVDDWLWICNTFNWFCTITYWLICVSVCSYALLICLWAWCAQSACLQRSGDLSKNTHLDFWSMSMYIFVDSCYFFFLCPISVAATPRRLQTKHAPRILEHVACVFGCPDVILLAFCWYSLLYHLVLWFGAICNYFVGIKLPVIAI